MASDNNERMSLVNRKNLLIMIEALKIDLAKNEKKIEDVLKVCANK